MEKEKGITLIALVVTIIVLIILAGVSLDLVLGENGIITIAKKTKEITEKTILNEEESFNRIAEYINQLEESIKEKPKEYAYDNPYIPKGFKHTEGTWNNGYTIKGITENVKDEFVWIPCVLDQNKVKEGDTVVNFGKKLDGEYYKGSFGLLPRDPQIIPEDNSIEEIKTSVEKYGGFYLAKYEAGIEETVENSALTIKMPTDGSVKPLSQAGKGVWNYITREDAITVAKSMINESVEVKSALVSAEVWDTTLQWMVNASDNKDKEPNLEYDINSTMKGWYSDTDTKETPTKTGYYSVNGIYDMAGNVWEWTTENARYNNKDIIISRGGAYYYTGSHAYVAMRSSFDVTRYPRDMESQWVGFRVVIYK